MFYKIENYIYRINPNHTTSEFAVKKPISINSKSFKFFLNFIKHDKFLDEVVNISEIPEVEI